MKDNHSVYRRVHVEFTHIYIYIPYGGEFLHGYPSYLPYKCGVNNC